MKKFSIPEKNICSFNITHNCIRLYTSISILRSMYVLIEQPYVSSLKLRNHIKFLKEDTSKGKLKFIGNIEFDIILKS